MTISAGSMSFFLPVLIILLGISIGWYSFIQDKKIFWGRINLLNGILFNSFLHCASISTIFFGVIIYFAIRDHTHPSINDILGFLGISLVPGIIVFLGSLWSYFIVGKYRDLLFGIISKKNK
jgi:hypothetical protein